MDEIVEEIKEPRSSVDRWINDMVSQIGKSAEMGQPPESLQYTNHWDFDGCAAYGAKYPGRLPVLCNPDVVSHPPRLVILINEYGRKSYYL